MTQKELKRKIQDTFKTINVSLKLLKIYQEMALLKKDIDRDVFEKKVEEHIGKLDFDYICHLVKYEGNTDKI